MIGERLTDAVDARRASEQARAVWIADAARARCNAHAVDALRAVGASGHARAKHTDATVAADLRTDAGWHARRATLAKHALLTVGASRRARRRRQATGSHETIGRDDGRRDNDRLRCAKENARIDSGRVRHGAPLGIGRRRLTLARRFGKRARRARARTVGCCRARLILSTTTSATIDVDLNLHNFRKFKSICRTKE